MSAPAVSPSHRGRFAPSPTGPLHMGSLLAAVGSYLQSRHHGGQWLLRIEDLDPPREVAGASSAILKSLEAHGFEWDGPVIWQSKRAAAYQTALDALWQGGHIFACRCSRRDIEEHAPAGRDGPVYQGTCRNAGLKDGRGTALRFRCPPGDLRFEDQLQGRFCEDPAHDFGDFIVRRRDGLTAYQLAVVVDDAAQGIDEVVRGYDLLASTARQILLQQALGYSRPAYLHLPILLGLDGTKLSKQCGAAPLDDHLPVANLLTAHRLLRQLPPETAPASAREFWAWAIPRWNPAVLKNVREIAAPAA